TRCTLSSTSVPTPTNNHLTHVSTHYAMSCLPPSQLSLFPVRSGPYWIVPSQDGMTIFVACPGSDEMVVFDVAAKKEKTRLKFPAGDRPTRMIDLAVPVTPAARTSR